jgi:hypothetical protein
MDIASSLLVPDWSRGSIRGNQGVVIAETGFKVAQVEVESGGVVTPCGGLVLADAQKGHLENGLELEEQAAQLAHAERVAADAVLQVRRVLPDHQGLTLVQFSAQLKCILWDRGALRCCLWVV